MSNKLTTAGTVKIGDTIMVDGSPSKVMNISKSKPGNHGSAKISIVAVCILDKKKRDVVFPGSEKIEVPLVEKKTAQVLSVTGDKANVMDMTSFETFDIDIPADLADQVKEGSTVLYWEMVGQKILKQVKSE